jgi:Nucleoside-diphosphate-sugar epimerases
MKEKLIVLGNTGFIGKSICLSSTFKKKYKIYGYNSKNLDLNFYKKIKINFLKNIENSILIFTGGKHRIYGDTKKLQKYNEKIFNNLLKVLIKKKPKKVIFLSTIEVYGKPKKGEKIYEKSKLRPIYNYAKGKINIEKKLIYQAKKYKFNYLILRLPGIFGKNDKNISIVSKLYNSFYKEKFYLNGDGTKEKKIICILMI